MLPDACKANRYIRSGVTPYLTLEFQPVLSQLWDNWTGAATLSAGDRWMQEYLAPVAWIAQAGDTPVWASHMKLNLPWVGSIGWPVQPSEAGL